MNPQMDKLQTQEGDHRSESGVYIDLRSLSRLEHFARGFTFLPQQPVHSLLAGRRGSRLRGRGLNFEELRHYLPGDDVRNMDWKATARLREPQVRVYTEERDRPCLLLVDQRVSMFFGSQRSMKSVVAAEIAALAAWRVFHAQDRVGAIVFNDTDCVEIKPLRSRDQVLRVLGAVTKQNRQLRADLPHSPNAGMFNHALKQAERLAHHDHLVILISDGYGADPASKQCGDRMAAHNDLLMAFVFDPLEAALPNAGSLLGSDGIRQLEMDSSSRSLRSGFEMQFADRMARLQEITQRNRMPLLALSTADDVLSQIRRQLGGWLFPKLAGVR